MANGRFVQNYLITMDLKKIQDVEKESMFGSVFGVSGPGMCHQGAVVHILFL